MISFLEFLHLFYLDHSLKMISFSVVSVQFTKKIWKDVTDWQTIQIIIYYIGLQPDLLETK